MLVWLANELYGDTRYTNNSTQLDLYFDRFGPNGEDYLPNLVYLLAQTNVGQRLVELYTVQMAGTHSEWRAPNNRPKLIGLEEYALVEAEYESHWVHVGKSLDSLQPRFR